MAFSTAVTKRTVVGNLRLVTGTFTNTSGSSGGDVATGLRRVLHFDPVYTGTAVGTQVPAVNETLPLSGGDVTIVTEADLDGTWVALGE